MEGHITGVSPQGGIAPVPSKIGLSAKDVEKLLETARKLSKAGLSAAGRALKKHGDRAGSIYPKAVGNQSAINQQGEKILKSILENPSVVIKEHKVRSVGEVTDYQIPGGMGARYSKDGQSFIGFLEP